MFWPHWENLTYPFFHCTYVSTRSHSLLIEYPFMNTVVEWFWRGHYLSHWLIDDLQWQLMWWYDHRVFIWFISFDLVVWVVKLLHLWIVCKVCCYRFIFVGLCWLGGIFCWFSICCLMIITCVDYLLLYWTVLLIGCFVTFFIIYLAFFLLLVIFNYNFINFLC